MANLYYSLGHWVWQDGELPGWYPPTGSVACVDLRGIPAQALAGSYGDRPYGFFATASTLDSSYAALGQGDCREIQVTGSLRDAWESLLGYRPQGDYLVDLLWDQLTAGSDPSGEEPTSPLMPTVQGTLELHLHGHSCVRAERFRWGRHPHTERVRDVLHRDYRRIAVDVENGRAGRDKDRQVLDYWADQYRLSGDAWKELIPPELRKGHKGRLKHATTVSDDFNRPDNTNPGVLWAEVNGGFAISSNRLVTTDTGEEPRARHEADLSSADHYCQIRAVAEGGGASPQNTYFGAATRFSPSANTHYLGWCRRAAAQARRIMKYVGGIGTELAVSITTQSVPYDVKLESNGSLHRLFKDASQILSSTDTAITGNLRLGCGFRGSPAAGTGQALDDFLGEDLAIPGHPAARRLGLCGSDFRPVEIGRTSVRIF